MWNADLRGFDTEKKPNSKKPSINTFMSFISSKNTLHVSASLVCFALFFTSTTMCFFWFCLQRCDIYAYMKAQVRWLNYMNSTPGSLSLMSPSPSSGQTKTGAADLDRFASFILTSVKSRQTHTLGSIRRSRSSGPQGSYVFVARLSDTDDIFKQEQQVLPPFSTYRRKPSCGYWCYSEIYMDRLK